MKIQLMHAGEAGLLVIAAVIIGAIELTKRLKAKRERRVAEQTQASSAGVEAKDIEG